MMSCMKSSGFFLETNRIKYFKAKICVSEEMFSVYFLCDVCSKTFLVGYLVFDNMYNFCASKQMLGILKKKTNYLFIYFLEHFQGEHVYLNSLFSKNIHVHVYICTYFLNVRGNGDRFVLISHK